MLMVMILSTLTSPAMAAPDDQKKWTNGLPTDPDYFPIAVWLQSPHNAEKYQAIGINLYVGLHQGPTEAMLSALEKAKMPVICDQNDFALKNLDRKIIVAWMHGDEPDNAQPAPGGGWGPPIPPAVIEKGYQQIVKNDPTRPVLLNLGQGVAWDNWIGRGERTRKPEDYPLYIKGADIVSFDIYPAVEENAEVAGKLHFVADGVKRLMGWTGGKKIIWNCIETTRIHNLNVKPTPHQVKAEVWMSIIHGSRGLIYFSHQFKPEFIEAGLLADKEMSDAVKQINADIRSLASVINSDEPKIAATATSSDPAKAPIALMTRRGKDATYVFAVAMRDVPADVTFKLAGLGAKPVEVIGESRKLASKSDEWQDRFDGYGVHLYRIAD
jgi:hypothetical protein